MIISQDTDLAGRIRIVWEHTDGNTYRFKFTELPDDTTISALAEEQAQIIDVSNTPSITFDLSIYAPLIKEFLQNVKDRPNLTFAQYNSYMNSIPWNNAVILKVVLFKMAETLADRKSIALVDFTEQQVLQVLRDYIVATPLRKLAKLILNEISL